VTKPSRRPIPRGPSYQGLRPASEAASRVMRANRKKDTAHEVLLRRALWRLGLRYRKHVAGLPGHPDLVFARARVVIFCDGDFWHGRDWDRLQEQLRRRHNAAYWLAKIGRNRERDRHNTALLEAQGWMVLRFWETDVKKDPDIVARSIEAVVRSRRGGGRR
jgi:DNA mismatch endonuclease (patch repair protein)